MTRRLRGDGGFTLIETLVTMAIMGIVMTVFGQVLLTSSKTSNRVEEQATLQNEVRVVVDQLTTDLRQATNAGGTSPVEAVSSTSLTFVSPDRQTPFHLRRMIDSVTGPSVFTFYDADGNATTDPTTVRSARISLRVSPRQAQGGSAAFSALVSIRTLQ
jgi:prepilin-type N-terminal cleavage/methylation domain-containing protein